MEPELNRSVSEKMSKRAEMSFMKSNRKLWLREGHVVNTGSILFGSKQMETKKNRTITISVLLIALIVFCFNPVYGYPDSIKWEDIADHLIEKSIPLIQLNLCDFPNNTQNIEPDRVVSQIIENTYYLWEEFDIIMGEDACMCIFMKKPNPGPLSAHEAQVLLTGSMLWRTSITNTEKRLKYNLNEFHPENENIEPFRPEAVIGTDDRIRITNTTAFPWNTHCFLDITFNPEKVSEPYGRGTGCLVSPYMVLTCAHNIYDYKSGSFIEKMTVRPGLRQEHKNSTPIEPYGSKDIVGFGIAPEFVDNNNVVYEYGAVFLDEPFDGINTFMPVEFSLSLSNEYINTAYIAGYPGVVKTGTAQVETESYALWDASGPINEIYKDAILYTTDTSEGDSGAPIRNREFSIDPYRIIGIHSRSSNEEKINGGSRLGAHNQALISEWMQWIPEIIFEDTFPSQAIYNSEWTVVNDVTVIAEPSGSCSLRLNGYPSGGDSVESRVIDLSLYSNVTLTYRYQRTGRGESPDDGDDLVIEYYNGSSWIELDRKLGDGPDMPAFEKSILDLPTTSLCSNFKLRFRNIGTSNSTNVYDDWFVDDVRIIAFKPLMEEAIAGTWTFHKWIDSSPFDRQFNSIDSTISFNSDGTFTHESIGGIWEMSGLSISWEESDTYYTGSIFATAIMRGTWIESSNMLGVEDSTGTWEANKIEPPIPTPLPSDPVRGYINIYGYVRTYTGIGVSGVTVTFTNSVNSASSTTDSKGYYSLTIPVAMFPVIPNQPTTITASKEGYTFTGPFSSADTPNNFFAEAF